MKYLLFLAILLSSSSLISADNDNFDVRKAQSEDVTTLDRASKHITSVLVPRDEKTALKLYLRAGADGDFLGFVHAARLLENGLCIERNAERAAVLYAKGEQGLSSLPESELNGEQLFRLGRIYKSGHGGEVRPNEAQSCLEKSSALGYPPAMRSLGMQMINRQSESSKETGVRLICDASLQNDLVAIMILSSLVKREDIDEEDRRAAKGTRRKVIRNLVEDVDNGDVVSMHQLGLLYIAKKERVREGITLLEKGGQMGSVQSFVELGYIYTKGMPGVNRDLELARKYMAMAADLGDCRATIFLDSFGENTDDQ